MLANWLAEAENNRVMRVRNLISNLRLGTILVFILTLAIVGLVIWQFPNGVNEQAKATYVVGFSAIILGVWQFRRTFTQKNKIKVFEEIKAKIDAAKMHWILLIRVIKIYSSN